MAEVQITMNFTYSNNGGNIYIFLRHRSAFTSAAKQTENHRPQKKTKEIARRPDKKKLPEGLSTTIARRPQPPLLIFGLLSTSTHSPTCLVSALLPQYPVPEVVTKAVTTLPRQHLVLIRRLPLLVSQVPVNHGQRSLIRSSSAVVSGERTMLGRARSAQSRLGQRVRQPSLCEHGVVASELGVLGGEGTPVLGDHLVEVREGLEPLCW